MFKHRNIGLPLFLLITIAVVALVWFAVPGPGGNTTVIAPQQSGDKKDGGSSMAKQPVAWKEGKALFKSNCAACHNPKAESTGPALLGATTRWNAGGEYKGKTGEQWMRLWIRNWDEPVKAGYKYAVDMANSRGTEMNRFTFLKDEDIDKILLYTENPDGVTKVSKLP